PPSVRPRSAPRALTFAPAVPANCGVARPPIARCPREALMRPTAISARTTSACGSAATRTPAASRRSSRPTTPAADRLSSGAMTPDAVLEFWFGEPAHDEETQKRKVRRWFQGGEEMDHEIAERFGALHAQAARGELDDWAQTPRGRLA